EFQRNTLLTSEVTGKRAPDDRDVYLFTRNCVDNARRWILFGVIAVDCVAFDVLNYVAARECVCWRSVAEVVADHLNAKLQRTQLRIIQRFNPQLSLAIKKHVRGAVVGDGR